MGLCHCSRKDDEFPFRSATQEMSLCNPSGDVQQENGYNMFSAGVLFRVRSFHGKTGKVNQLNHRLQGQNFQILSFKPHIYGQDQVKGAFHGLLLG